jgi:hypothetical protein
MATHAVGYHNERRFGVDIESILIGFSLAPSVAFRSETEVPARGCQVVAHF